MEFINALPEDLLANVRSMCAHRGEDWLHALPDLIKVLEERWNVVAGDVYPASGINYVAPAVGRLGELFVLKINPPYDNSEYRCEAAFLRSRQGRGCIRLIEEHIDSRAMLLERAVPGETMDEMFAGREPECVAPAIELLRAITERPIEALRYE